MNVRRLFLPALIVVGSLTGAVTPAAAATRTVTGALRGFDVVTTTCAPTAAIGTPCRVFSIEVTSSQPPDSPTVKSFEVIGGLSTLGAGWDIGSGYSVIAHGTATVGTVTGSGTSGSATFTVNMVCDSAPTPCAISGPHTIALKLSSSSTTAYIREQSATNVQQEGTCSLSVTQKTADVSGVGGSGSVKVGNSTAKLRVWTKGGYLNVLKNLSIKGKLVNEELCDSSVVVAAVKARLAAAARV